MRRRGFLSLSLYVSLSVSLSLSLSLSVERKSTKPSEIQVHILEERAKMGKYVSKTARPARLLGTSLGF